jgi:hypothetical protein
MPLQMRSGKDRCDDHAQQDIIQLWKEYLYAPWSPATQAVEKGCGSRSHVLATLQSGTGDSTTATSSSIGVLSGVVHIHPVAFADGSVSRS